MKKTKTICFANNKGGSGKSTTCSNVGYGLRELGYKVLLIDGDMQLNLSLSLFDEDQVLAFAQSEKNLYEGLKRQDDLSDYIVHSAYEGLDLIPSSTLMSSIEYELFTKWQREFILRKCLKQVKESGAYDYILIDAPPTLGGWVMNILCASDEIIIPVESTPWGLFGLGNMFEFLEEEEEDQTVEHPVSVENLEGNVSFDHVHFGYNADRIIVNDFSAEVKEGQKIAIVGPTGAGKTTMIKLLMRFYDVNSGSIKIDGHDVRDFNRSELREMFGMVLQDTWLFNGSIWDNIKYGKLDATDEEVIQAAKAAHVHQFVKTLPGGYDMELNEEANNVSQGQKQLLTIARAILADPKILILDEATSSVDTRTEVLIQKAMDNLMKGRTSFVIAHRLSTIRDADMILVMKDGDIVEQGNHEELLAKGGFYADLYNSQFEKTTEVA